ncbi:hypothetical protein ABEB36_010746 [Hypothenemus hampei]|uniref:Dol-P-Glc:Glc(2)Man(9)GlcNAc(2)-PP-Dol alpha-1,2-glucosyltransferase n=1 Tax=Hypothenemus hampei TaxID=57062 RepID=A0ABD1ECZ9_HYPHA
MTRSSIFLLVTFTSYAILSKILFDYIYSAANLIVDEEFHLPLGEQYCKFHFNTWDPKVTTLPGLYLVSSALLGPFGLCSIYWLRSISLLFSCINLLLFYVLFSRTVQNEWQKVSLAIMMNLLPPLYFMSHIYYTDIVSLTTVLIFIILNERGQHYFASLAGFFSIICRQTNVIFVAIYGGKYVLKGLYDSWVQKTDPFKKAGDFPIKNVKPFLLDILGNPFKILQNTTIHFWLNSLCYLSLLVFFLVFLIVNGGIVVGDRNAHHISINIPQLFYFSLFCLIFGWPHFLGEVLNFVTFAKNHKVFILIFTFIAFVIVHFNTVVHPYLLADNRHLIFYVWSRFYGKYWWFRYAIIPVYVFSLYVLFKILWNPRDVSFFILFTVGVTLLLVSQSLLELRYFLLPYIIIRVKTKNVDTAVFNMVLEFVTYSVMNMITFNIFFTKTLYWTDMDYPQRIIW